MGVQCKNKISCPVYRGRAMNGKIGPVDSSKNENGW